jgi:hypothetical protein
LFKDDIGLRNECIKLVSHSLAKRSWDKYNSALTLWNKFAREGNVKTFSSLNFTCWCSKNTKLRAATVKSYLSSLRKIKFLLGFKRKEKSKLEKILLRGMENVELISQPEPRPVVPVDLNLLVKIKEGLDNADISHASKMSIWALSLAAFWGLLRLGEILPLFADKFDKTTVLLWRDVNLSPNKVVFHIKAPKTRSNQGKTVVLYKLSNELFCPVKHMEYLEKVQKRKGLWGKDLPVFLRASGKALTKISFIKGINAALLAEGVMNCELQCKSFRSGIPSLIGSSEDEWSEKGLKKLGRWKGSSYHCYIRNQDLVSRKMFTEISEKLLTEFMCRKEAAAKDPNPGEQ